MKNLLKFSFLVLTLGLLVVSCKNKPSGDAAKTAAAETAAKATAAATSYAINTVSSKVFWVGSKPTGSHNGSIDLSEGKLSVTDGKLTGGSFVLNMNSITNLDQKPGEGKEDLEAHLKGLKEDNADHFFNVTKYPTATFAITKVDPVAGGGDATHNITGNLTIKETTKSITFPASVAILANKVTAVTPSFKINRTEWGVNFKSKSVFDNLKDKFIDDEIALNIQLETK